MKSLPHPLLCGIWKDPSAFLTERTLLSLSSYFAGYRDAEVALLGRSQRGWNDLDFVAWLERRFGVEHWGTRSSTSIVGMVHGDDSDALQAYFELLHEYWVSTGCALVEDCDKADPDPDGDNLVKILTLFRQRPRMFVGCKSLRALRAWIDGYIRSHVDLGRPLPGEVRLADALSFVRKEHGAPDSSPWHKVLLYTYGDDEGAVDRFFELCDRCGFFESRSSAP